MTRHLASLASGRLVIGLEDGYDLDTLSEAGAAPRTRGHHDTSGDTCKPRGGEEGQECDLLGS